MLRNFDPYRDLFEGHDFMAVFLMSLFTESEKRRIDEGVGGLLLDACKQTVALLKSLIASFQDGPVYTRHWTPSDYHSLADVYADHVCNSRSYKVAVAAWLREYRSELLGEVSGRRRLPKHLGYFYEESPMETLKRALDRIAYVGTQEASFEVKDKLTAVYRAGVAVLPDRCDWVGRMIRINNPRHTV